MFHSISKRYLYKVDLPSWMSAERTQANCVSGSEVMPYVWSCSPRPVSATEASNSRALGATMRLSNFATDIVTCEACSKLWKGLSLWCIKTGRRQCEQGDPKSNHWFVKRRMRMDSRVQVSNVSDVVLQLFEDSSVKLNVPGFFCNNSRVVERGQ